MTSEEYRKLINNYLESAIPVASESCRALAESMNYSLLAGGKRIRPMLCLEFARICGGAIEKTLPIACGIEMLHTYSLIHDDLPCMDNDDLRRGRPTNHKVYGECTATLSGDALQAQAFASVLSAADIPAENRSRCALILAEASGYKGMCGGQFMDMEAEGKVLDESGLTGINNLKTGALLSAACSMGVAAACSDEKLISAAASFGSLLGLAFQIRDDMLDVLSTREELGKSIGSDAEENKNTYMAILGEEKCAKAVHELTKQATNILKESFSSTQFLEELAASLEKRKN